MCGISGIFSFNELGRIHLVNLAKATKRLAHRGPDAQGLWNDEMVGLGHRRLSIIDLNTAANQPMSDPSGRYHLVYNGEIYNYQSLRNELVQKGFSFHTDCDTEVLLYMLIAYGEDCLERLNGFFAFAFYDQEKQEMLVARDRMGIKPLYFLHDENKFLFASELGAIMDFGVEKKVDSTSLFTYLQLNYLPAPMSMLQGIKKLMPGHFVKVKKGDVRYSPWYKIPYPPQQVFQGNYESAQQELRRLMEQAVQDRMLADVPLGSFLSGGIDSSVVATIASQHTSKLHTFSIGYTDNPFFDETHYAHLVAKKIGSEHTVFKLSTDDLYARLHDMLNSLSEPFADSSSLPFYVLSEMTKKHVTVALSGDGADELFSGYNKHAALYRMLQPSMLEKSVIGMSKLWDILPKSRNNSITNSFRQFKRFADAAKLPNDEKYWFLASLQSEEKAARMIHSNILEQMDMEKFQKWKSHMLQQFKGQHISDYLRLDCQLVLEGDMLPKVDLMSMAHALEVRVPFLDYRLIEFVFSLPDDYKINRSMKKRILQDAFRDTLPIELYQRPKHGFEVPLLNWLRSGLWKEISGDWLDSEFLEEQAIFDVDEVQLLLRKLHSNNPEDSHAHVWALIVFQQWWKNHLA